MITIFTAKRVADMTLKNQCTFHLPSEIDDAIEAMRGSGWNNRRRMTRSKVVETAIREMYAGHSLSVARHTVSAEQIADREDVI